MAVSQQSFDLAQGIGQLGITIFTAGHHGHLLRGEDTTAVPLHARVEVLKRSLVAGFHALKEHTVRSPELIVEVARRHDVRRPLHLVGVNVQDRIYGMVHLTVPWRPDWLEQADGRGRRQGNKWSTWGEGIHSVAVVTTGSYDVVSWQMIEQKATFISAIVNDEYEGRTADDIGDLVVTANVAKAIALGDMRVIEKTQLEVELMQHQRRYRLWREEKRRRADMARKLPGDIADLEARVGTLRAMAGHRDGHTGSSPSIVLLDNGRAIHPSTRDEANQRVFVLAERLRNRSRGEVELGTYRGLDLTLSFGSVGIEVVAQYPAVEQMAGYASVADIVVKVVADVFGAIDYQLGALDNEIAAWQQQAQQLRDHLAEVSGDMESWQSETARAALARYEALCTELADGGPVDRKSFDLGVLWV